MQAETSRPTVSVVCPVFNERENLPELYEQLRTALDATALPWEILFVDDGSTDGSGETIQQLHGADSRVRGILLLSLIHISEPTRLLSISYAVFCLKKKNKNSMH